MHASWVQSFYRLGLSWQGLCSLQMARVAASQPLTTTPWPIRNSGGQQPARVSFRYTVGGNGDRVQLQGDLWQAKARLTVEPGNCWLLNSVGVYLVRLGKIAEALPYLRRAAECGPREATIWANLGVAWVEMGEMVRGLDGLDRALQLARKDPWVLGQAAGCLERIGWPLEAGALFARALELAPGTLELETGRIRCLLRAQHYFEALRVLDKLVLAHSSPDLWHLKAVVHEALGGHEAAMRAYNRALGLA